MAQSEVSSAPSYSSQDAAETQRLSCAEAGEALVSEEDDLEQFGMEITGELLDLFPEGRPKESSRSYDIGVQGTGLRVLPLHTQQPTELAVAHHLKDKEAVRIPQGDSPCQEAATSSLFVLISSKEKAILPSPS